MRKRLTKQAVRKLTARRQAAHRAAAKNAGRKLDALLLTSPPDVSHLSGFTGDDSFLLIGRRWACLVTDGRYAEQAQAECRSIDVHVRRGPMSAAIAEAMKGRKVRSLGFQSECVTVQWLGAMEKALPGKRLVAAPGATAELRAIKDADDLRAIRKAIRVAEGAFSKLIRRGCKGLLGRSEKDVAAELEYLMRQGGAASGAFETIVATGANSSHPHYRPCEDKIRRGQCVLFDWGARVDGYCSDLTRVVFTGRIPAKLAEIYEVVLRAQTVAIAAIRPGVACKSPDTAARKLLDKPSCGGEYLHSLGHGVGRAVHEAPAMGKNAKGRLKAGMVVTVEPGLYLPGVGGVRIEDMVLVTSNGRRRLSSLPRCLADMVLR